jgi:FKBP-type peptidyl-prolyl cis-trans isomerase FklB
MKRIIISLAAVVVASIGLADDKPTATPKDQKDQKAVPTPTATLKDQKDSKDQKDKVSYSIGYDIGSTFKKQNVELNMDTLLTGMKDAMSGGKEAIKKEDRDKILQDFQKEMVEKQAAATKAAGEKNAAEGEKFLAENGKKEGVKTTASGLQYKVLKEGTGESPKATDTVVTNYKGTLLDGTEFDSSYKRNEPATFPVNRVIPGWTEALQLMKPGAKYQLFIPSKLAYGERGAGRDIGPNATLIFEVELLSIKPPETVAPGAANAPTATAPPKPTAK